MISVAAAAAPRLVSADDLRRGRGGAATTRLQKIRAAKVRVRGVVHALQTTLDLKRLLEVLQRGVKFALASVVARHVVKRDRSSGRVPLRQDLGFFEELQDHREVLLLEVGHREQIAHLADGFARAPDLVRARAEEVLPQDLRWFLVRRPRRGYSAETRRGDAAAPEPDRPRRSDARGRKRRLARIGPGSRRGSLRGASSREPRRKDRRFSARPRDEAALHALERFQVLAVLLEIRARLVDALQREQLRVVLPLHALVHGSGGGRAFEARERRAVRVGRGARRTNEPRRRSFAKAASFGRCRGGYGATSAFFRSSSLAEPLVERAVGTYSLSRRCPADFCARGRRRTRDAGATRATVVRLSYEGRSAILCTLYGNFPRGGAGATARPRRRSGRRRRRATSGVGRRPARW